MNNSKWFYSINSDTDSFSELEYEVSDNPDYDELNKIAQKILREEGYTEDDDFVCIGKGELITIEMLGSCFGVEIIEMLEDTAHDNYGCDELFSSVSKDDVLDLDRRIAQALKEWDEEHSIMSGYYTILDTECYYYHGDMFNKEEQQ